MRSALGAVRRRRTRSTRIAWNSALARTDLGPLSTKWLISSTRWGPASRGRPTSWVKTSSGSGRAYWAIRSAVPSGPQLSMRSLAQASVVSRSWRWSIWERVSETAERSRWCSAPSRLSRVGRQEVIGSSRESGDSRPSAGTRQRRESLENSASLRVSSSSSA
ncbi:hypothetical protein [Kitasatospora sp. NPDC059803]|uniref:hypothetical protein n=1 Tax=Kitasatospora sp. NPDC059803 TaxID=3346953 RepID=UPI0036502F72